MHSVVDCKSYNTDLCEKTVKLCTFKRDVSTAFFDKVENLKSCERNIRSISFAKKFINESFRHANYSKNIHMNFTILRLLFQGVDNVN